MDPIADMLNKIKNAAKAGKESVSFSHSKIKEAIVNVLKEAGYLQSVVVSSDKKFGKRIEAKLVFTKKGTSVVSKINNITRVSKPSRRIYKNVAEIVPVNQGFGLAVVSTNKGLMTDVEARKKGLGGELLCKIW